MDSGEKPTIASSSASMLSLSSFTFPNLVPQFFTEYQERLSEWRDRLGLLNPGTCENLHKEVMRDVFLTNHMFSGMRADLGKSFSANPLFQIQHSFSAGSSQVAPWSFLSMYSTDNVFLQGNLDSDLQLMARCHVALNAQNVTKIMTQVSLSLYFIDETSPSQPGGVFQIEHDISLPSTSINIKTMNPDFTSQSFQGVVISSILQSITPRLSLGLESAWQRQPMAGLAPEANTLPSETSTSFLAKFTGVNKDWVAAATLMPANGALNATFWRRLGEKVEAGVALDLKAGTATTMPQGGGLMAAPMMARVREGTATVGVKYEFRTSMFRGQIDSGGRVSAFLDKRLSPQIGVSFCGDIDHFKGVAKFGIGLSIEASDVPDEYAPQIHMEGDQI